MPTEQAETARVTTEMVSAAIAALPIETFTTFDVAASMGVAEYPVRAAMSWLLKFGVVKRVGSKQCFTKPVRRERCHFRPGKCEPYMATTYELTRREEVDCDLLNWIFLHA